MNILFYFPTNKRTNSIEVLMQEFSNIGHNVVLIGMEKAGDLQIWADENGISHQEHVLDKGSPIRYYARHVRLLSKAIKNHKIDLVYSHTQPANIVAAITQYICSARFIICRHHSDYIMNGDNKNAKRFDKIINWLGKEFIVPSPKVYQQMTEIEGVAPKKVRLIPYAYNFDKYPSPINDTVLRIRQDFPCDLLLVTVSRFIPCKRYDLLIQVIHSLISEGKDIRLLILGSGPLESDLRAQVSKLELNEKVKFIGFTTEVMNYLAAADTVVHTSNSEASNSVIKEAGLLEKLIIACRGVGDFDEYIDHRNNGFLISTENTASDLKEVLLEVLSNENDYTDYGRKLKESVIKKFSYLNIVPMYTEVFQG